MSIQEILVNNSHIENGEPIGHVDGYFGDVFCRNIHSLQPSVPIQYLLLNPDTTPPSLDNNYAPLCVNRITNEILCCNPIRYLNVFTPPDNAGDFVALIDANGGKYYAKDWNVCISAFDNNLPSANANATYRVKFVELGPTHGPNEGVIGVQYYNNADSDTECYIQVILISKIFGGNYVAP